MDIGELEKNAEKAANLLKALSNDKRLLILCALYKKEVQLPDFELPSDYSGVVYTPLDSGGGWKILLAKELKAAGLKIDMNKLL